MPSTDAELIHQLVEDTNRHLDILQRRSLLWADAEGHIAASHLAESVGDLPLVSRHLQTAIRLLAEIHLA